MQSKYVEVLEFWLDCNFVLCFESSQFFMRKSVKKKNSIHQCELSCKLNIVNICNYTILTLNKHYLISGPTVYVAGTRMNDNYSV